MDLFDLKNKIIPIVRSVREMLLPFYGNCNFKDKEGRENDVVTELDVSVEDFLRDRFIKLDSSYSFVGEENDGDRTANRFWLCDPIDGTAHFIRGLPFCTTMLALIEDGQVIASVIYDFVNDNMYYACMGEGAFCDGKPLFVSERPLQKAYLSWEVQYKKIENEKIVLDLLRCASTFKSLNAGFEFAMVASGKLDGRICVNPYGKDYDYAPGTFLVQEAGGIVTNIGSDKYDYRDLNFIASNKNVHSNLTQGIDSLFSKKIIL